MRLTPAQAGQLARLAEGGSLPRSRITKSLLVILEQAGIIRHEKSGPSYVVRGLPGRIEDFVEHQWGIRDLRRYAVATPEQRSRESLAEIAGDSKALPNHPLAGVFMRFFGSWTLAGRPLSPTPIGSALFISPGELPQLRIAASMLIAIENPACFLRFEKALTHFAKLDLVTVALVLRWSWRAAWRAWLRQWQGGFLYFPDYDRAGLRIFATEVLPHCPNARLLIPAGFSGLVKTRGSRRLFLRHEHLAVLNPQHPDIGLVQSEIDSSRKALEQESLLKPPTVES